MKNFVITAMGRSGTRFLAENMNKSKIWTVKHEAGNWKDMRRSPQEIQKRFNRDYYAEVNGYLRFMIDDLNVEKKGIILRNPVDLWLSITTWHSQAKWRRTLQQKWAHDFNQLMAAIPHMLRLAESGRYFVIDFDRMVKSRNYLKEIFKYFGVADVRVTKSMLDTRVNSTPTVIRRRTMGDFKPKIRKAIFMLNEHYQVRTRRIFGKDKEEPCQSDTL